MRGYSKPTLECQEELESWRREMQVERRGSRRGAFPLSPAMQKEAANRNQAQHDTRIARVDAMPF
jgi:hypothetical protein